MPKQTVHQVHSGDFSDSIQCFPAVVQQGVIAPLFSKAEATGIYLLPSQFLGKPESCSTKGAAERDSSRKERLLLSWSASCHLLPVKPNLSCEAMEAQPKLRDSKKEPEAATGGKVSVPMPRTARCATPPGSQKGMLEMNQAISHEKNVHEEERSTNPAFSVLFQNTCPRRVIKDKHSTVQNTNTVSMAWYLGLLKPARLTAISSAGGKAL